VIKIVSFKREFIELEFKYPFLVLLETLNHLKKVSKRIDKFL